VPLPEMPTARSQQPTGTWKSVRSYWRSTGDQGSVQVGGSSHVGPPPVDLQYRLQCPGEARKVAVVDAAVVELVGEFSEDP